MALPFCAKQGVNCCVEVFLFAFDIHQNLLLFGFSVLWEGLESGLFVLNINVLYSDLFRLLLLFLTDPQSEIFLPRPQNGQLDMFETF